MTPPTARVANDAGPSFSDVEHYERLMGRWSRQLAPAFLAFADVGAAQRLLDVGCGTGALCQALGEALPDGEVTGVDLSPPFVQACAARLSTPQFTFQVADAAVLPFADGRFDAVLSMLVLMLVDDPLRVAEQMLRVTRPRGIAAACTWDADGMEMIAAVWDEARALDARAPIRAGRQACARPGALSALWSGLGFAAVVEKPISISMRFRSFEDFWLPLTTGVGPAGRYVASAPGELRRALRERLRSRLLGAAHDRPFVLAAKALAVRGIAP